MMRLLSSLALVATTALACETCYGPQTDVVMTRNVRRMQPDAQNATTGPKAPLEWGQINFMHTTDTHGWLEGHIKEQNYGADWGDYVSFTRVMKNKAKSLGVDLLLVDTGDLHDGAGLSDATSPNGLLSNPIFENVDYDLLTIGNHELYVSEIAYEHFNQFAKVYGERYLTSNVQILNPATNQFEYIGRQYRYFTTEQGLRVMAFGVLFDFTGNSNVSRVIKGATMVNQTWFQEAVNYPKPIDMFLLIGHNPVRGSGSTLTTVFSAIRKVKPNVPIQVFGGHTHIRDFAVYDNKATGLESGRYCETLGWLSISGLNISSYNATSSPSGVPHPTRSAIATPSGTGSATVYATPTSTTSSSLRYSRRYIDWNRRSFAYHAEGSQDGTFDTQQGKALTATITSDRQQLNLSTLYGCAPQTWCLSCKPFGDPGNIYTLLATALSTVVVNQTRKDVPRIILINTGSIRFDLVKGPFTYDDSFIVAPFSDSFMFIKDVPWSQASQILPILNAGAYQRKRSLPELEREDFGFQIPSAFTGQPEKCLDPPITHDHLGKRKYSGGRMLKRQSTTVPGYVTIDDFGKDGDDTPHSPIPYYSQPNDLQANASFPTDGSMPDKVDVVFLDFIESYVVNALNSVGGKYNIGTVTATNGAKTGGDADYYLPASFTTNSYLPAYAKIAWQQNVPNCPVGEGVGFGTK